MHLPTRTDQLDLATLRRLAPLVREGLYVTDRQRRILLWNPTAERITGYREQDVLGRSCADGILIHVNDRGAQLCHGLCPLAACMQDGRGRDNHAYLHHRLGHRVPVSIRVTPLHGPDGEIDGALELFSAQGLSVEQRARFEHLAPLGLLDELTGLPARGYLEAECDAALGQLRGLGIPTGLIMLSLDDLDALREEHGPRVGDRALVSVAETLCGCLRLSDTPARWNASTLAVVLRHAPLHTVPRIAFRLSSILRHVGVSVGRPARCGGATGGGRDDGRQLRLHVSAGATGAQPEDDTASLVARCEHLLRVSRAGGGGRVLVS